MEGWEGGGKEEAGSLEGDGCRRGCAPFYMFFAKGKCLTMHKKEAFSVWKVDATVKLVPIKRGVINH